MRTKRPVVFWKGWVVEEDGTLDDGGMEKRVEEPTDRRGAPSFQGTHFELRLGKAADPSKIGQPL